MKPLLLLILLLITISPVQANESCGTTYITYNYTRIYQYTDEDIELQNRLGEKLYQTNLSAIFWKNRAIHCENNTIQEQTIILTMSREEAENLTSNTSFDMILPLVEVPKYIEVPEVRFVEVPSSSNDKLRASNEALRASSERLRSALIVLSILIGVFFVCLLTTFRTIRTLNRNLGLLEEPEETPKETTPREPTFEDYCVFALQVTASEYKDFNEAHNDLMLKHEYNKKTLKGWDTSDRFYIWWSSTYGDQPKKTNTQIKKKGLGGQEL